jgi:hypothetical protein
LVPAECGHRSEQSNGAFVAKRGLLLATWSTLSSVPILYLMLGFPVDRRFLAIPLKPLVEASSSGTNPTLSAHP